MDYGRKFLHEIKDPNTMARKRSKNSKSSFNGLGLHPSHDVLLIKALKDNELSCQKLVRALVKEWLQKVYPNEQIDHLVTDPKYKM